MLIERLESEGGTLRLPNPSTEERASYRRLLHLCKKAGLVPDGAELLHTGRDQGDMIIRLSQGTDDDATAWNRIRLNVRRTTTEPGALVAAITEKPHCLKVTETSLPRAIKLIGILAKAAIAAGYSIGVNTKPKTPKLFLQAGDLQRELTLEEEYDKVRHVTTDEDRRALRSRFWTPPPAFDTVASGRLTLRISRAGWNEEHTWADEKGARLERRLAAIMDDVRRGLAEDEQARIEAKRLADEERAKWEREEAEQREQWHRAIASARRYAIEDIRRQTFRQAYDRWTAAEQIRTFCAALAENPQPARHLQQWITWARAAADGLDPTINPRVLAEVDFDRVPGPDDLRPYLGDWSPHEPRKEYRYRPPDAPPRAPKRSSWWRV
ncbi:hypothetical protein GCM10009789_36940 [Kribbella sancticallisti]|uniref:Uncharacterized protein n=1 Tax=Kribbella sancticallisti TaxID=460087 RepID=A0ABP4PG69_9ACTN